MLFEMNTLIILFHSLKHISAFLDTILCVKFLNFLRKIAQVIFKLKM